MSVLGDVGRGERKNYVKRLALETFNKTEKSRSKKPRPKRVFRHTKIRSVSGRHRRQKTLRITLPTWFRKNQESQLYSSFYILIVCLLQWELRFEVLILRGLTFLFSSPSYPKVKTNIVSWRTGNLHLL